MEPRFRRLIRRAQQVRAELRRSKEKKMDGMTKYGYDQGEKKDGEKTAAEKGVCPQCGSPLSGNPPVCPKCGSEPFEKKEAE